VAIGAAAVSGEFGAGGRPLTADTVCVKVATCMMAIAAGAAGPQMGQRLGHAGIAWSRATSSHRACGAPG